MTAFNFFSHGSQDAYPSYFLKGQHHFDTHLASLMTAVGNVGAICGGLFFGILSQRIGRRGAIIVAALIALPVLPFWAFGSTPLILAAGAFLMQVSVQGAWGVIPAHLNELSPAEIRAYVSRGRLPARQPAGRDQFEPAGGDRRGSRQRLRAGAGGWWSGRWRS